MREFGVPPGGALDQRALFIANALAGNSEALDAIEVCLGSIELEFVRPAFLGICGAASAAIVDGELHSVPSSIYIRSGQRLKLEPTNRGVATYIAAYGGFASGIPPLRRRYSKLEELEYKFLDLPPNLRPTAISVPADESSDRLRFIAVPNSDSFRGAYAVSPQSSRAGVRLMGMPLRCEHHWKSSPVDVGVIQITNEGLPIVVGPDGPVSGGYAVLGAVVYADQDRFFQLVPGSNCEFESIGFDGAEKLFREREVTIHRICDEILKIVRG